MPLCPIKWQPLKFFAKLHKSPLLIANIVKGAVSGLRQFQANENPWKITKNAFYFILTNWIFYWQIKFCTYYAFSLNQMSDIWFNIWFNICQYLTILAIKRWFLVNFAKILHFVVGGPKTFKLFAGISFESSLQNTVLSSLRLFLCACY